MNLDPSNSAPAAPASTPAPKSASHTFRIATMDCASEESEIRRSLDPLPGIRGLGFVLIERTLRIDADAEALPDALAALRSAGFDPQPVAPNAAQSQRLNRNGRDAGQDQAHGGENGSERDVKHIHQDGEAGEHDDGHDQGLNPYGGWAAGIKRLALALLFAIGAETLAFFAPNRLEWTVAGMVIAAIAIWLAGLDTYKKGIAALLRGKLNINALMAIAVTGAFLIGQWPEAAMVMALYAIAELIEAAAVDRARNSIKGLMALAPDTAQVKQSDGSWRTVAAQDATIDNEVRVKPGERIALDGVVTVGKSAVNQAAVTGESIPVEKSVGDPLFAGTINESGALEFRVTAPASNSTIARIILAVEQAQGTRAPTQRFVDRFAAIYTPAVFALALAVALLTPWLLDWTMQQAIYKALVLLVIACPCALVLATPVTVVSGLATAARQGILIKGGSYLEEARKLRALALDKTGTITEGQPKLVSWQVLSAVTRKESIEAIAASLASRSDHPVSNAIALGLNPASLEVEQFQALPGRGVQGTVAHEIYTLGNHRLMEERKLCNAQVEAALTEHERAGRTVTLLADSTKVLAVFAVADTIKVSSKAAIAELKDLGIRSVMLTGDNSATASSIAAQAGIDEARGNLLPEHKLEAIKQLQARHGHTGMTGDGINDAPALAQANIGFAMGAAGTDVAVDAADIVIMNDDLRRIATTVRLSRKTYGILWQNIALALGIKVVFLVLAVFGNASMWMAVFADMGASLLVVANGLRLLRAAK